MEKERARYQKDLQDFERTVHQTRTKYQGERILLYVVPNYLLT